MRERLATGAGVLLLGLGAFGAGNRESSEGAAYAVGAVLGSVAGALLLAALVRWIYLRLTRRRGAVADWPWLLLTAGVIAVIVALARAGSEAEEADRAVERARDCRDAAGPVFVPLGNGLTYGELDGARQRLLAEALPPNVRDLYEARLVLEGRTTVGVVFAAAVGDDADARRDFEAGFTDRARERGAAPRPDTLDGSRITTAVIDGQNVVTGFTECYGVAVSSANLPSAKLIARPLLRD